MTHALAAWLAASAAFAITCYLSLALGALRSYSLARLEALLAGDRPRRERLLLLLEDEDLLVLSVNGLRGVLTTCGIVAMTFALVTEVGPGWLAWTAAAALAALVFVALAHLIPHAIGERRAEPVLSRCLQSVHLLRVATVPIHWLFRGLIWLALRVAQIPEEDEAEEIKDEILSAALAGQSEGVIDEQTKDVIRNLIEFRDVAVGEVMTKRPDIVTLELSDDLQAWVKKALEHQFSRLPVTDKSLDRVVGILMVKDLFRAALEKKEDARTLIRPAIFVPETKKVAVLLKELRTRKNHMAIVADEHGGTAGLVTFEDLIEEIIGEIDDEHDMAERPPIRRLSESELDLDAKVAIEELNEQLGTMIPEDDQVETIGGYVTMRLGKIPVKGDRVALNGYQLTVTDADERRVRRVHLKRAASAAT
jgi:CBS domain containing-hemolysin-like protein